MATQPIMHRQGDVLLIPVSGDVPAGMKEVQRDNGRVILAYGEVTGHAHAITESWAKLFEMADERILVLPAEAKLVHEEHTHQNIAPGSYRVVIQKEYVPRELPRNVAD